MSAQIELVKLEQLFNALLQLPVDQRHSYLQQACPDDLETQQQVLRMVERVNADTQKELHWPINSLSDEPFDEEPGTMLGRYRLVHRIGEGGMGVVYEAEQTEPVNRRVALKLIKLGMDTKQVLARFQSERQVLARMQHPNIASFYDAGTTDQGRPYFVMEYIEGTPITTYCDEQGLSIPERIKLFLQVCDGVQHAHQKGVIHRDLKPSNVLAITDQENTLIKIIDFGIARIAAEQSENTILTQAGQWLGTPDYMSPEQIRSRGVDVDTRSDVFALGVILYRLLTGQLPRENQVLESIHIDIPKPSVRVSEENAQRRSTTVTALKRTLQSDLDWIVLKALHSDRERRYLSAAEFANDLRRYLDGKPVLAGPDSIPYRLKKFVHRHRVLVGAGSMVILALLGAVVFSSRFALQAEQERQEALRQTRIATAVNEFLNRDLLENADPKNDPDREVTLREIVDRSANTLGERFDDEPLVEAMIRMTLAQTYLSLSELDEAEVHFRRALELRRSFLGEQAADTLETTVGLSGLLYEAGKYQEGLALLEPAIDLINSTIAKDDFLRLSSINNLALLHDALGHWEQALATYQHAVEIHEQVLGRHHIETLTAINNYAITLTEARRYEEAQPLLEEVLAVRRQDLGNEHPDTILSLGSVAFGHMQLGDYDAAEPLLEEATTLGRRVLGNSHWWQANNLGLLGQTYLVNQKPERALTVNVEGLTALIENLGENHPVVIGLKGNQGMIEAALGHHDSADSLFAPALSYYESNYGIDDQRTHRILLRKQWIEKMAGRCAAAQSVIEKLPQTAIERMQVDPELKGLNRYPNPCN